MNFCSPQIPASSYPERLSEYLQKQQQQQQQEQSSSSSSSPLFLEHLEIDDADDATIDEVTAVMGRSFAGNPERPGEGVTNWCIGPDFPVEDPACEAKRVEFVSFLMRFNLLTCLEYGVVLLARDRNRDGKVLGAVFSYPPGTSHVVTDTRMLRWPVIKIAFRMRKKLKPPGDLGKEPWERMAPVADFIVRVHDPAKASTIASSDKGTPPWYVFCLGTDVDAQGKGVGTALLDAIHHLADCDATDTMLEYNGEKKRGFYCGKMGYKDFGEQVLVSDPKKEKDDLAVKMTAAIRYHRKPQQQQQQQQQ